ncbi:MAG: phosphonate ABC transporter, permease protein PhnE [Candidatus Accumulibacter phosphatis]|uniref:Phosphate-import permease protein PhnE n=3 Tax=Candidatus Accumulibacter TaxID=327159 RepID=A0A080M6B4_9PROT|nr:MULTISPECIES: phosphonate ABC transporter, permease protein PhnE [Candidatus Accumulibacter]KFB76788.1 MAG: Phosphate-import permease protein PhnE [Candidatus Accumulibacter cognatus]MBL8400918.1 phosphonate ABC transporter, permease protein PhnE [Accumulibacter sp.]MCC2868442.1 phosphonate ABC transporter, permease protein PhnE [Candidatus Accumulibacter phosphatis]MCM8623764.1 phosphonate ABC transporter, permease protein PhnE [Accumulibacter sp.]MCQ1549430.1 phosphonate ABC transporter, 
MNANDVQEPCAARGAADFCLSCVLTSGLLIAAVVASFAYLAIDFGALFSADSAAAMGKFAISFLPPDLDPEFVRKTAWGALQTFSVAMVGTLLATLAGLLLSLPAAGRQGVATARLSRFLLNLLRSVPELVWATLMVLVAGLGPFAGALALALHTTGVLGRLFAEAIENAPRQPEQSLREAGSGGVPAFLYGTQPLVWPQCVAYGLYRLEMNIRMAAVLGFVGAGGLGQMLYYHLSIFQQAQAATVLIAMFILVLAVDALSDRLRKRMASV